MVSRDRPRSRIVNVDVARILDTAILDNIIAHCKDRVGFLSLKLDTMAFAVYARLGVTLDNPLSEKHFCEVTMRDTYDISIESRGKPSIEAAKMWLKIVFDKDFENLRITTVA